MHNGQALHTYISTWKCAHVHWRLAEIYHLMLNDMDIQDYCWYLFVVSIKPAVSHSNFIPLCHSYCLPAWSRILFKMPTPSSPAVSHPIFLRCSPLFLVYSIHSSGNCTLQTAMGNDQTMEFSFSVSVSRRVCSLIKVHIYSIHLKTACSNTGLHLKCAWHWKMHLHTILHLMWLLLKYSCVKSLITAATTLNTQLVPPLVPHPQCPIQYLKKKLYSHHPWEEPRHSARTHPPSVHQPSEPALVSVEAHRPGPHQWSLQMTQHKSFTVTLTQVFLFADKPCANLVNHIM